MTSKTSKITKPETGSVEEAENNEDIMVLDQTETSTPGLSVKTTEDVRQGHTGNHVRYILALSIAGAALMFAVVLMVWVA